jgi:hypothetical protein
MEGHAAMDMSVQRSGSFAQRLFSADGYTAVAQVFVMEWAAIIRDLIIGLIVAGAIAAWVPDRFWRFFFFAGHPLAAKVGTAHRPGRSRRLVRVLHRERPAGRGPVPGRHLLGDDARLRRPRPDPEPGTRPDSRPGRVLGLHHLAEYHLPRAAAALIVRFARTGGVAMLRMMGGSPDNHEHDQMDSHASHTD